MISSVFMIVTLLWLTVSLPYVVASQQENAGDLIANSSGHGGGDEETANPFGNTTEEKAPGNSGSQSEEYLHDHHTSEHFASLALQFHKLQNAGLYIAYHGELHVPPPNKA